MGEYYNAYPMPAELRRTFDVYDRIRELGIDLGSWEQHVGSLQGANIAGAVIAECGLVYLSGIGTGTLPMRDDPARIRHGQEAGREAADDHIRRLHWVLSCGGEGDLNDVLYTVKALGMVVSPGDGAFGGAPAVVNGYSLRWQSVFGGGAGDYATDGIDPGGFAGVHARSAMGGFDGKFSQEPEIIVAIPPDLARAIIQHRGWVFPLPPAIHQRLQRERQG
jgi:hypothetical protein